MGTKIIVSGLQRAGFSGGWCETSMSNAAAITCVFLSVCRVPGLG